MTAISLHSTVFSAESKAPGRINAAMVAIMNSSSVFQKLFAVLDSNRVKIVIGEAGKEIGSAGSCVAWLSTLTILRFPLS